MTAANYCNPHAQCLQIFLDPTDDLWGAPWGGATLDPVYGRILIVREDQISITVRQVEALCAFFKKIWGSIRKLHRHLNSDRMKASKLELSEVTRLREDLMREQICREEFEKFFRGYKETKIKDGDISWKDEKSPYDVTARQNDETDVKDGSHKGDKKDLEKGLEASGSKDDGL